MIVRDDGVNLILITQPDHARLAGSIMEKCRELADHPRRAAVLRACYEHDGGWIEVDARPEIDPSTGRLLDFLTERARTKQSVWPRAVARLSDDPWAAALVAMHALTVYFRFRDDPEWADFFPEMMRSRDALVGESGLTLADLDADYPLVRLADLISLTFCNQWTVPQTFADWTVTGMGAHVSVSPDPFGDRVPFAVGALRVPARRFSSRDDLHAAIGAGEAVTLSGTAGGRASFRR